jgi:hypothetical protein
MTATVLTQEGEFAVEATDGLLLTPAEFERVTGWSVKPEGLCRDEVCMPMPEALRAGRVDVAAFWERLGNPVLSDDARTAWVLGAGAQARRDALGSLQAPEFELPDLDGTVHRLSALRGKKVFLATWASW